LGRIVEEKKGENGNKMKDNFEAGGDDLGGFSVLVMGVLEVFGGGMRGIIGNWG
jgi:hypothetical protein